MNEEKVQFPTLDEVKKGINELLLIEKWDRYKYRSSPKKFKRRFHELFASKFGLMPYAMILTHPRFHKFTFYRLRKWTKSMNPALISEYSYPPNHVVKSIQRANVPHHPVFYCSDNPETAIFETVGTKLDPSKNDVYYLSEWELDDSFSFRICPFVFGNVDESNPAAKMLDTLVENLRNVFKEYSEDQQEAVLEILKFLSSLFVYDNTYFVSSYIAHSYLYADHNLRADLFIYPSVRTGRKTLNYAIHPNVVSERLRLKRVFQLKVMKLDVKQEKLDLSFMKRGTNRDGIIYWNEPNPSTDEGKEVIEELDLLFKKTSFSGSDH